MTTQHPPNSQNNGGQRHNRSALILYASETGNSQDVADQLDRITQRLRFNTKVSAMDNVNINELLKYSFVIFCISTTGQGEIPANGKKFWRSLLRKRLPPGCLRHVKFTSFGLGDSSYVKFNWAARKLHKRLVQLGAHEFYPRGEADEQHDEGIDGTLLPWSIDFKAHLLKEYPLPDGLLPIPDSQFLKPKVLLQIAETNGETTNNLNVKDSSSTTNKDSSKMDTEITIDKPLKEDHPNEPLEAVDELRPETSWLDIPYSKIVTVEDNIRITPEDHWQDVRHIVMHVNENIHYKPGDSITIWPKNFPVDVDALIELQGWEDVADLPLIKHNTLNDTCCTYVPYLDHVQPTFNPTLRALLTHNLDITAIPRRYFFDLCAKFCDDNTHRDRLLEFCNPAYTDEFFDYATRPRRSILEVLQDFPTVKFPWKYVLAIFPELRGRQYSISCGGIYRHPDDDHEETMLNITVALVKYRTVLKKIRQGVCSRYLSSLRPGTKIAIQVRQGSFRLTSDMYRKPLLLIAPGTGIAPMRSILQEREFELALYDEDMQKPRAVLIYGGRNKEKDFLYKEDWYLMSNLKVLTAFSRDQREKIYVQDVVRQNSAMVWEILKPFLIKPESGNREEGGGAVFVCGSSGKMPVGVRLAIKECVMKEGKMDEDDAERYLAGLEASGRFVQETW